MTDPRHAELDDLLVVVAEALAHQGIAIKVLMRALEDLKVPKSHLQAQLAEANRRRFSADAAWWTAQLREGLAFQRASQPDQERWILERWLGESQGPTGETND